MSSQFSLKQETKKQYIKNFFKNSKALLAGFSTPEQARDYHQKAWFEKFCDKNNDYTREELLFPKHNQLDVCYSASRLGQRHKQGNVLKGFNGLWRVNVFSRHNKTLDLDISVRAGREYRFHSGVIKNSICSKYGAETYDQWRQIVKADLASLDVLVGEVRKHLKTVPWSYTCSPSSERLCKQVPVYVHRGVAFLFPDSYR